MTYQLVLQWQLHEIDYEKLIEIEDLLIDHLPEDEIDGHDIGAGQANTFVLTNNPTNSWETIRRILEGDDAATFVRVAYRALTQDLYVIVWPRTLDHFTVV